MGEDLKKFHTWHLIRILLLRASFQYHSAGISSGRSHAAYVYDAWALSFPYTGPQLIEVPIEDLVAELHQRSCLNATQQLIFHFDIRTLSSVEITMVAVRCMAQCHDYLTDSGYSLNDAIAAVNGVISYLSTPRNDLAHYIPPKLKQGETSINPADIVELKRIVEELERRRELITIDPYRGIIPLP